VLRLVIFKHQLVVSMFACVYKWKLQMYVCVIWRDLRQIFTLKSTLKNHSSFYGKAEKWAEYKKSFIYKMCQETLISTTTTQQIKFLLIS
jgi:hypothetical protein